MGTSTTNVSRRNSAGASQAVQGKKAQKSRHQYDPKLAMLWKMFGLISAAPADVRSQIIADYENTFSQITHECVARTLRQSPSESLAAGSNQIQVTVPESFASLLDYLKVNPHIVEQLMAESRRQR